MDVTNAWKDRWRPWLPLMAVMLLAIYFVATALLNPLPALADTPCGRAAVPLQVIQGTGTASGRQEEWLTTEAVVTAVYTGDDGFGGFFFQQPLNEGPEKPGASRALFVYAPDADVAVGERLRLRGQVSEYRGMTQLSRISIEARCETDVPIEPVAVALPLSEESRHQFQAMRVRLEPPLTVVGTYELGRYGTIKLADERLYIPTQVARPGDAAREIARQNRARLLRLDDGSRRQNPDPIPYPPPELDADNTLRVGDQLDAVEAVLDYRYGDWRLQPVTPPAFRTANPRPEPPPAPDQLRVAGFNVENYFNGENGFPTPRGAANRRELARQEAKLFSVLQGLQASVIGLVEVGNDGFDDNSSLASLAGSLGKQWHWAIPDDGFAGSDEIRNGIIYDRDRVSAVGSARYLTTAPFDRMNRPPVLQQFRDRETDQTFMVVVNHFKSKRCQDARGKNADQGDGQACWNALRTEAAEALVAWLGDIRAASGETRLLILGDLNAYAREDPLQRLEEAGYRNLQVDREGEPAPYSYVFRGQSGTLDYGLASPELASRVQHIATWAINADEPAVLDYRLRGKSRRQRESLYHAGPWRSSDHDPVWVDLDLAD